MLKLFRLLLLFFAPFCVLHAKPSYDVGKKLYMQKGCFGCHGTKLEGLHKYPPLANRAKGYMTYKLKRFRSKLSDNQQQEMMVAFAVDLSDRDIDNLTTYMYEFVEEKSSKKYDDSLKSYGDGGS